MLIDSQVLDRFSEALTSTLAMMAGVETAPGSALQKHVDLSNGDISSVIGFGGDSVTGCLVLHFSSEAALMIYENMMGENPGELNTEVRDGIGEIANIVLGSAKTAFAAEGVDFQISIPTVVIGIGHRVRLQSSLPVMVIPFQLGDSPCSMEVAIKFGAN
ncbi:MAG: chemotaxis protein CheX [Calditrichaeota bacterium]|nr:chemotaxis protein CheX [Candidatus Cloacimonadota bacterium]MCB1046327.1 chemotaxis protein CheX [Calditrichota bacterium]MCB9473864.1 chemotaxis protein CheX [Candidatus Delongbacteria bacterium]